MITMFAFAAAAALSALDGSPEPAFRLAEPVSTPQDTSPRLAAPSGSALTLTPRLGIAVCGYCGLLVGGAGTVQMGPWFGGVFIEGAAVPAMDAFSTDPDTPLVAKSSAFLGLVAGRLVELKQSPMWLGLSLEGGAQGAWATATWDGAGTVTSPRRSQAAHRWFPLVGARALAAFRFGAFPGLLGLGAFVRQPLSTPCMNVWNGCDRPATTVGGVFELSIDVRRRGADSSGSPTNGAAVESIDAHGAQLR